MAAWDVFGGLVGYEAKVIVHTRAKRSRALEKCVGITSGLTLSNIFANTKTTASEK